MEKDKFELKKGDLIRLRGRWTISFTEKKFVGEHGDLVFIMGIEKQGNRFISYNMRTNKTSTYSISHFDTILYRPNRSPKGFELLGRDMSLKTAKVLYGAL